MSASACPDLTFPKAGRIKLTGSAYQKVVHAAYARDGWQCKVCHKRSGLTPHHMIKRSTLRLDTVENILTLCSLCNQAEKDGLLTIVWIDQSNRTVRVTRVALSQKKTKPGRPLAITAPSEDRGIEENGMALAPIVEEF